MSRTILCDICEKKYAAWRFRTKFIMQLWGIIFRKDSLISNYDVCDNCLDVVKRYVNKQIT